MVKFSDIKFVNSPCDEGTMIDGVLTITERAIVSSMQFLHGFIGDREDQLFRLTISHRIFGTVYGDVIDDLIKLRSEASKATRDRNADRVIEIIDVMLDKFKKARTT